MANKGKGDFGYRTRANRSGLDPVETDAEVGRASGYILAQLIFTRYHTRKPLVMVVLAVFGILLFLPLALAAYQQISSGNFPAAGWPLVIISALIGVALLVNALKNAVNFHH